MRREGASLRRIAGELGIALSTASLWTRGAEPDVQHTPALPASSATPIATAAGPLRRCPGCDRELPESLFSRMGQGFQGWCKSCFREYHAARRSRSQALTNARRRTSTRYVLDHLLARPCADCGEADPVVLEFDHVRGEKRADISRLVRHAAAAATLDAEIAKCDVVCMNCHRRRTRGRTLRKTPPLPHERRARAVIADRLAGGCVDCGERDVEVLDFDHRSGKRANISEMPRNGYSLKAIVAEIDLCEVRCGNCHRRRTAAERDFSRVRFLAAAG
jgi:hypothetical protein